MKGTKLGARSRGLYFPHRGAFQRRLHCEDELVAGAELVLEERGGAEALQLTARHDSDPVA